MPYPCEGLESQNFLVHALADILGSCWGKSCVSSNYKVSKPNPSNAVIWFISLGMSAILWKACSSGHWQASKNILSEPHE